MTVVEQVSPDSVSFVLRNLVHDEEEPGDFDASLNGNGDRVPFRAGSAGHFGLIGSSFETEAFFFATLKVRTMGPVCALRTVREKSMLLTRGLTLSYGKVLRVLSSQRKSGVSEIFSSYHATCSAECRVKNARLLVLLSVTASTTGGVSARSTMNCAFTWTRTAESVLTPSGTSAPTKVCASFQKARRFS